jgi:hypothetical protein
VLVVTDGFAPSVKGDGEKGKRPLQEEKMLERLLLVSLTGIFVFAFAPYFYVLVDVIR